MAFNYGGVLLGLCGRIVGRIQLPALVNIPDRLAVNWLLKQWQFTGYVCRKKFFINAYVKSSP